jgi:hypothetical protein
VGQDAVVPIDVVVRTARGDNVALLRDVWPHLPPSQRVAPDRPEVPFPLVEGNADNFPMLASVDPYGNTCFNRRQVPLLLGELDRLQAADPSDERASLLAGLRVLTTAHMRTSHTYLWFVGD